MTNASILSGADKQGTRLGFASCYLRRASPFEFPIPHSNLLSACGNECVGAPMIPEMANTFAVQLCTN